jgi:uncharacterized protein (DUF58 family)
MKRTTRNRLLYIIIIVLFLGAAWAYGGAMVYFTLYALLIMPLLSLAVSFIALRGLKITQYTEYTELIKNEPGRYEVSIHNRTPLMHGDIECQFIDDHFAVEADRSFSTVYARPFKKETHIINFRVRYRGIYRLGLSRLLITDQLGLFVLKRKLYDTITLTVWPRLIDIPYFPLVTNILSQSNSLFEIREEDYSTVSDVRKYEPTDPLKRVHWKLTAKRNEWMVKNFQTNALNRVTVLTDTFKLSDIYEEALILEDMIIETSMAVMNYCLRRGMPVEWYARNDVRREAFNSGQFETLYHMAVNLTFDGTVESASVLPLLNKCINEYSGYLNAVLFTVDLSPALYERVINAERIGHSISVLYFTRKKRDTDAADILGKLQSSGIYCRMITPDTDLTHGMDEI